MATRRTGEQQKIGKDEVSSRGTVTEVRARLSARDAQGALNLLRQLRAEYPPVFWRNGRWRLWEEAGFALEEAGEPAAAAEAFAALHALRPRHVPTLVRLGAAWAAAGEYGRAFHAYYTVLELEPDHAQVHFLLGNLYNALHDLVRACRAYERAVSLRPQEGVYWASLGFALQARGDAARALSCYEKASRLDPDDPGVWNALGLLQAQAGEARKGAAALRRALRLKPDDPGILLNLSTVYGRDLEDYPRALRYARRLLELEPNHAGAHHNLGLIHWALGELDEAEIHLRRALELGPDIQEIWASYNAFRRFLTED